jgi:hypothetical protein
MMTSPDGSVIAWIAPDLASFVRPVDCVPFCGSPSSGTGAAGAGAEAAGAEGPGAAGTLRAATNDVKQPEVAMIIMTSAVFITVNGNMATRRMTKAL